MSARALHYVFKIGDRKKAYDFFVGTLNMKVLRHEEFGEGCAAECNGPYNGKWSKTMVGYGGEDKHFVIELTYNYEIGGYKLGNDYKAIHITSSDLVTKHALLKKEGADSIELHDPDGHLFVIKEGVVEYPVTRVAVNVKNLEKSVDFWNKQLSMNIVESSPKRAVLSYGSDQAELELVEVGSDVDRGSAYGRIAFSYPGAKLKALQDAVQSAGCTVLKPFVTLETPGKADVQVVILADPDGHEICFVGEEGFADLSKVDPGADASLQEEMKKDWSEEWFKDGKKTV